MITAALPIERNGVVSHVAGDDQGGIAVFQQDCSLKGRVLVSRDPGGIRGLRPSMEAGSVLFFSAHAFGFFSVPRLDQPLPPCGDWLTPAIDAAIDPWDRSRVMVALE